MLELVIAPDPRLLKKCEPCEINSKNGQPDSDLASLAEQMIQVMYESVGVGLAAPQVGIHKRLIVIDCDYDIEDVENTADPLVLVNPTIINKSEEMEEATEGCLSCPGVEIPVNRHVSVEVEYYDLCGNKHTIIGLELLSHCLQHEIDHLDGKTLFQTCLPQHRIQLLQSYQQAIENGEINK